MQSLVSTIQEAAVEGAVLVVVVVVVVVVGGDRERVVVGTYSGNLLAVSKAVDEGL